MVCAADFSHGLGPGSNSVQGKDVLSLLWVIMTGGLSFVTNDYELGDLPYPSRIKCRAIGKEPAKKLLEVALPETNQ